MSVQLWRRPGVALLLTLWIVLAMVPSAGAAGAGQATPRAATVDDAPASLFIPRIDLETPIVSVGWQVRYGSRVWDVPANAAGWHLGSAYVGEDNNLVLSGHNNIGGSVFRALDELAVGDTIIIRSQVSSRRYTVSTRLVLREVMQSMEQRIENARWIGEFEDERVTLITCYPAWTNTHRLVIVAVPDEAVARSRAWTSGLTEE